MYQWIRLLKMDVNMKLIYLSCLFMGVATESRFKGYCYDVPGLNCAEKHILDCDEGQVITTDIANFHVAFLKNKDAPECQNEDDECKNKTSCCTFISGKTVQEVTLLADNIAPLIKFIQTECSSKSSCIVSSYYSSIDSSDRYDYVTYNYGCIPATKDAITVDFLVNGQTRFTGNKFPTVNYLDYTGNGTKENDVILNRECIVTTTDKDITLKIKTLNLQADDCCRFHISGYSVSDYCSHNGSFIAPKRRNIGSNTATIRLENVVNKDDDSYSILVTAADNVTINCTDITNVDKQESITCQYPTPESSTVSKSTTSPTTSKDEISENQKTNHCESDLAAIIGGTVGVLVFLNIIFIIIVVLIVRRKLRTKQTDEIQHYSSLDGLRNSSENNYAGMETASPTRA